MKPIEIHSKHSNFERYRALRCLCDLFAQSHRPHASPGASIPLPLDVRYMDMVAKVLELQPRPQTPGLSVPIEAIEALK